MKLSILGTRVTVMNIGARQLAARGPRSKGKKTSVLKTVGAPAIDSPYANQVWAAFTKGAIQGRDHTMEEVNAFVAASVGGLDTGYDGRKRAKAMAKRAEADAHLRMFEARSRGGAVGYRSVPMRESAYPPY